MNKIKISDGLLLATLFLVLALVVLLEPDRIEFTPGHHGWVSSGALAMIKKATMEHGWLGYIGQTLSDSGERQYAYFSRYPVIYTAIASYFLRLADLPFSGEIHLARQLMNVLFVGVMALYWRILVYVRIPKMAALNAVTLSECRARSALCAGLLSEGPVWGKKQGIS
jgi:hypothetical protein